MAFARADRSIKSVSLANRDVRFVRWRPIARRADSERSRTQRVRQGRFESGRRGFHSSDKSRVVVWRVDARRAACDDLDKHRCPVFQHPQLFEFFDLLQSARPPTGVFQQECPAIGINAQVQQIVRLSAIPRIGNRRTREVERTPVRADDHLHTIRIGGLASGGKDMPECHSGNPGRRPCWIRRLSTSGSISGSSPCTLRMMSSAAPILRATSAIRVSSAGVVGIGHDRFAAERSDRIGNPGVVGRDQHAIHTAREAYTLDDVLNQKLARLARQRLARKASRAVARGNHSDRGHERDGNAARTMALIRRDLNRDREGAGTTRGCPSRSGAHFCYPRSFACAVPIKGMCGAKLPSRMIAAILALASGEVGPVQCAGRSTGQDRKVAAHPVRSTCIVHLAAAGGVI